MSRVAKKAAESPPPEHRAPWRPLGRLGPGLITGAADDDPSGIATYSQAGAQFGLNMLWTVAVTYPLMVAVQLISARIGRVTGKGLGANLAAIFPKGVVSALALLLFVTNTVNIGADIGAMGAAGQLMTGVDQRLFMVVFALISLGLQLFVPYHRYVHVLKWLTLALFAYVGVIFAVRLDWLQVIAHTIAPDVTFNEPTLTMIVAVFGTTISPYLFFWQSSEEVEELEVKHEPDLLHETAPHAKAELSRIRFDTFVGMAFSNLIAFFIILTTAVTLHTAGKVDIQTSSEAAAALKPIAGQMAFALFTLGIIGTGFLALPVLAGSSAYAIGEARNWKTGLEHWPWEAWGFYAVIIASMLLGLGVVFSSLDPIKALFWAAVLNGASSVPIMAAMMIIAGRRQQMGRFVASRVETVFGWTATGVMALAVAAMVWSLVG